MGAGDWLFGGGDGGGGGGDFTFTGTGSHISVFNTLCASVALYLSPVGDLSHHRKLCICGDGSSGLTVRIVSDLWSQHWLGRIPYG